MIPQVLAQLDPLLEHICIFVQKTQTQTHHFLLQAGVHYFDLLPSCFLILASHLTWLPEILQIFIYQSMGMSYRVHVIANLQPLIRGFIIIITVEFVQWFIFVLTFGILSGHLNQLTGILGDGCFELLVRDGNLDLHDT